MRHRRNRYKIGKGRGRRSTSSLSFGRRRKEINKDSLKAGFLWTGEIILVVGVAALIVFFLGVRVPVIGQSMAGTLENGETVLVNRFVYRMFTPKANDIIVFLPNGNEKSHYYLKRVIAVPGDTVQIKEGKVYVNDKPFNEKIENPYVESGLLAEEPIVVGEDEYFVLGDNRNNSEDSRYANIGNVKKEHILGKAWFIIAPWESFGLLK